MTTKLCVPLTATDIDAILIEIDAATRAGAEAIELRLDYLAAWDEAGIQRLMQRAADFPGQVIATCRIAAEGGQWDGDESERVSLLEHAGLRGADYIDVEYQAWRSSANIRQKIGLVCDVNSDSIRPRRQLILSRHDFHGTPKDLDKMLAESFEPFTFSPVGAAIYQLGPFGTAAKQLKTWDWLSGKHSS